MEWSKIKTILIFVFAIVNVILLNAYLKGAYTGKNVTDETINNTVQILKQNNINIEASIIPTTFEDVKICSVENKFADPKDMIDYLCEDNEFASDIFKNVTFNQFGFECEFDAKDLKNADNLARYTKKFLKKTNIFADCEYKVEKKDKDVYFYMVFDNRVFFDTYIKASLIGDKIHLYGTNWLCDSVLENSQAEIVSPAEILINFSSDYNSNEVITITSIRSGYYLGTRTETMLVTAWPVWEITVSNGKTYYYDMRNGDLLK